MTIGGASGGSCVGVAGFAALCWFGGITPIMRVPASTTIQPCASRSAIAILFTSRHSASSRNRFARSVACATVIVDATALHASMTLARLSTNHRTRTPSRHLIASTVGRASSPIPSRTSSASPAVCPASSTMGYISIDYSTEVRRQRRRSCVCRCAPFSSAGSDFVQALTSARATVSARASLRAMYGTDLIGKRAPTSDACLTMRGGESAVECLGRGASAATVLCNQATAAARMGASRCPESQTIEAAAAAVCGIWHRVSPVTRRAVVREPRAVRSQIAKRCCGVGWAVDPSVRRWWRPAACRPIRAAPKRSIVLRLLTAHLVTKTRVTECRIQATKRPIEV